VQEEYFQAIKAKLMNLWKNYRALLLIAAVGAVLLLLPGEEEPEKQDSVTQEVGESFSLEQQEQRLEALLKEIRGVGRVSVLLTLEDDGEKFYARDWNTSREQGETSNRESEDSTPVLYGMSGGGEEPLLERTIQPRYRGVLIVCDGAEDPEVKLQVLESIRALLGLGSECVAVLPMKPE